MTLSAIQSVQWRWFIAFLLTLTLEAPVYIWLGRQYASVIKAAAAGALGSCVTHPLLWFVWRPFFDDYLLYVISGEIIVFLVEAVILRIIIREMPFSKALSISLLANATSYGIGLLLKLAGVF
ncbi:MAG: hypothetical protein JXR76_16640 [Deltaproteobacteria bacterium]|nr:hypothetical protein [Deltaproteobacteria bacterium]